MPALLNNNWYNANSSQRYPLMDNATGVGDDGVVLPNDIIVDMHLRFPLITGEYAFINGVTVSDRLVSVVIVAADSPTAVSGFTPLAAVTIQKPIVGGKHYPVSAIYPGVGGWIVFDDIVNQSGRNFVGRYSTPQQSLILPRCASPYRVPTITSIGKTLHSGSLTGLITIKTGSDLSVTRETLDIGGGERDALVFRLAQNDASRNILQEYTGDCSTRPESRNCDKPVIEFINTVAPNCDGNIDILFDETLLKSAPFADCGPGITLDLVVGLQEVCAASNPPVPLYIDLCQSSGVSENISEGPVSEESSLLVSDEPGIPCPELPFSTAFPGGDGSDLTIQSGFFEAYDPDSDPTTTFNSTSGSEISAATLGDCEYTAVGRTVTASFVLSGAYPKRNGGLIINRRVVTPLSNPHIEYFLALLDGNSSTFKLYRFNGSGLILEYTSDQFPVIIGQVYTMTVVTTALSENRAILAITVENPDVSPTPLLDVNIETARFAPQVGTFGIGAYQAFTYFSAFSVT